MFCSSIVYLLNFGEQINICPAPLPLISPCKFPKKKDTHITTILKYKNFNIDMKHIVSITIFSIVPMMSFCPLFCVFNYHVSLFSFNVSQSFLVFHDADIFESMDQLCYRMFLSLNLPDFFFQIRFRLCILARTLEELKGVLFKVLHLEEQDVYLMMILIAQVLLDFPTV